MISYDYSKLLNPETRSIFCQKVVNYMDKIKIPTVSLYTQLASHSSRKSNNSNSVKKNKGSARMV